ncbi:MAG: M28 family metallopeptidase [Oscillospiraceae bacterium]|nr:M28 family metallopeptidase [Oscillospiraceae bacterium]
MGKKQFSIAKYGALLLITATLLLAVIVGSVDIIRENSRETGAFDPANFTTRPIRAVSEDTPHGEISVAHIEFINDNFYNRIPFSFLELFAAQWIVEELLSMGYTWDEIEVQEFTWEASRDTYPMESIELFPGVDFTSILYTVGGMPFVHLDLRTSELSQNIILTVPGQSQCDTFIVVGAHYDSVMYPGASDNASGTALLLESAQRMRYLDNYYTIVYVFFGAEEVGILGAFYYVNNWSQEEHDNLLFMINADVLLEGPDLFYMAYEYTPASNHIIETWDEIAQRVNIEHDINLISFPQGAFLPSDQLAFIYHHHTVMALAGLNAVPNWSNMIMPYAAMNMSSVLHSPRDDFHYINRTWPGRIEANMRGFSIFLEELLLAEY